MLVGISIGSSPCKGGGWEGAVPLNRVVNCSVMLVRLSIGSSPCEGGGWEGVSSPSQEIMRRD